MVGWLGVPPTNTGISQTSQGIVVPWTQGKEWRCASLDKPSTRGLRAGSRSSILSPWQWWANWTVTWLRRLCNLHTHAYISYSIHIHTMWLERAHWSNPKILLLLKTFGAGAGSSVRYISLVGRSPWGCWVQWLQMKLSLKCYPNQRLFFNAEFGGYRNLNCFLPMATRPQGPNALAHPSGRVWATLRCASLVLLMFRLLQLLSWEIFSPARNENTQFFSRNKIDMIVENCASMYDLNGHIS